MSYIAFDLDALNVARDVGIAAGLPEERITHGLLRMWAWCFRERTDTVQDIQVQGFFGPDAAPALEAFGFLEKASGGYRVRGAERYLRVSEQRAKAGKARSSSAGRSAGRFTSSQPAADQRPTSGAPAKNQPLHRAPSTEHLTTGAARESEALCGDFEACLGAKYLWAGGRDGKALAELRKDASLEEVRKRWVRGLRLPSSAFAACRTLYELQRKWNHLATDVEAKAAHDPNAGLEKPTRFLG